MYPPCWTYQWLLVMSCFAHDLKGKALSSQAWGVLNFYASEVNSKCSRGWTLALAPSNGHYFIVALLQAKFSKKQRGLFAGDVFKPIGDRLRQWCWPGGIGSLNSFTGYAGQAPGGRGQWRNRRSCCVSGWRLGLCRQRDFLRPAGEQRERDLL